MRSIVDTSELDRFRGLLLNRRQELEAVTASGEESAETVVLDQSRVGRLSRMDALQMQAMSLAQRRRRELELQRIAAALKRLDDGDYGDCLDCGGAIARNRLQADPTAPLCIDCASRLESDAGYRACPS
jgi:DnaK suppressor protein